MIDTMHTDHKISHLVGMSMARQGFRAPRRAARVLVAMEPSTRAARRQRVLDSRSTAKKSRRNAARQAYAARRFEENLLGIARAYFDGTCTDAMWHTVTKHVQTIARQRSEQTGQEFSTSLKEVEGKLAAALERAAA